MYAENFDKQQLETIRGWVAQARQIVLLSHMNADGDACGSLLGMTLQLTRCADSASVTPILPNGCPATFGWLPGSDRILNGDLQREACAQAIAEADLLICVDLNAASRTDFLQDDILQARARKLLIDHHHSPALDQFDLVISDDSISSTCELCTWLSEALWDNRYMDANSATCFYTGLRTDTGGFAFSCHQPSCFEAAARLVAYDIQPAEIHNRIINTFTTQRMAFYGFAISQRLRVYDGRKTAIFAFSLADQRRFSVGGEDMEGLVNYTLMMKDIEVGVLLREEEGRTKVSFRAKGNTDVNMLARQLGGGGHTKAAGATCNMPFNIAVDAVTELLGLQNQHFQYLDPQ